MQTSPHSRPVAIGAGFVAAIGVALLAVSPAGAQTVTDHVTFSATGFAAFPSGGVPPANTVTGAFTITYNPTLTYTDTTTGISLGSLSTPLDSAISFNYSPTAFTPPGETTALAAGTLQVGGIADDTGLVQYSPATNDFVLTINNFTGPNPSINNLSYAEVAAGNYIFYTTTGATLQLTVTAVPEPAACALMLIGMGSLGAWSRRRRTGPLAARVPAG